MKWVGALFLPVPLSVSISLSLFWAVCSDVFLSLWFVCSPVDREKHHEPEARQDTGGNGKKGQNEQQWHHNKRSALVIHTVGYLGNAQIKCDWQPYML